MNRSYSKIRHIQESNMKLETRRFNQLLESKMGNVRPLINEQKTDPMMSGQPAGPQVQSKFDKNYFNTNKTGTMVLDISTQIAYPLVSTINGKPTILKGQDSQTELFNPYWKADFGGRVPANYKGNGNFTYSYDGTNINLIADASNEKSKQILPNGFLFEPKS